MPSSANPASSINHCQSRQHFNPANTMAEKGTLWAVIITAVMMVVEIAAGSIYNSMALLADGWHMSSHVVALGISLLAYVFARRYAGHQRFTFGTWKFEVLGGYSSAILLVGVAIFMAVHSIDRLIHPQAIDHNPAILVAVIGLVINLICARLLHGDHHHDHHHDHTHEHHHDSHNNHDAQEHDHENHHHHHDLNLRAAYLHVLSDALTSVFAIVALLGAKFYGLNWLDPVMGIIGSLLIVIWAYGLLKQTSLALLDADIHPSIQHEVDDLLKQLPSSHQIHDLHIWRVGKHQYACIMEIHSDELVDTAQIKQHLQQCHELVHITISTTVI